MRFDEQYEAYMSFIARGFRMSGTLLLSGDIGDFNIGLSSRAQP